MAKINADEIVMQRHRRSFLQLGGARPTNGIAYSGLNSQYFFINSVKIPQLGAITPRYVPDANVQGKYRQVNRSLVAPGLPTASILMHERHGAIPIQLGQLTCPFTIYDITGTCANLQDFYASGTDFVEIFSNMLITDKELGARTSEEKDDAAQDTLTVTLADYYVIGPMPFSTRDAGNLATEVVDAVYGNRETCGDCGPANPGTQLIYCLVKGGAASKPSVVYSLDGGLTWTASSITTAVNSEVPESIIIVGSNLAVVSSVGATTTTAIYVSAINQTTGAPSTTWTKVSPAAMIAAGLVYDSVVLSPSEIIFVGKGGYIYGSSDIATASAYYLIDAGSVSVADYNRVATDDEGNLYAVGQTNNIVRSNNRGQTWFATTTVPTAAFTAVAVLDRFRAWVGTSAGLVYYTINGGETWVATSFTADTPTAVKDITFPTDEVGFIAYTIAGPVGKLATTSCGGNKWTTSAPRLQNLPTALGYDRIVCPTASDSGVNTNNVLAVGLLSGILGIIAQGVATKL